MHIEKGKSGIFQRDTVLTLKNRSVSVGDVHFLPRTLLRPAQLTFIGTEPHSGTGYGRELLHAFIQEVGKGSVTTSEITHSETWKTLRQLGFLRRAYEEGLCRVTDHHRLSKEIPITQFLEKGGIHVQRLDITYGRKKQLPSYEAIEHQYDEIKDHFISFFRTQIFGIIR